MALLCSIAVTCAPFSQGTFCKVARTFYEGTRDSILLSIALESARFTPPPPLCALGRAESFPDFLVEESAQRDGVIGSRKDAVCYGVVVGSA